MVGLLWSIVISFVNFIHCLFKHCFPPVLLVVLSGTPITCMLVCLMVSHHLWSSVCFSLFFSFNFILSKEIIPMASELSQIIEYYVQCRYNWWPRYVEWSVKNHFEKYLTRIFSSFPHIPFKKKSIRSSVQSQIK